MNVRFDSVWRIVAIACLLQACSGTPVLSPPVIDTPPAWQVAFGFAVVERDWWTRFDDPALSRLVEHALARNSDARLAAARVAEARALSQVQHAVKFPTLDFSGGAQRARSINPVTRTPYYSDDAQPQFQAAYELDLWGRIDAQDRAAQASLVSSEFARDTTALSVAASVASAYINLRALDARLELARNTLTSREAALKLANARRERGYTSTLELSQAQAEYRATAQVIPRLVSTIEHQEHALRVLLGEPPGPIERGATLLALTAPVLPDAGLPSDLMRRRPDIAGAEAQLVASDAQLAAARAQLLPSFRLSANIGRVFSSALPRGPFTIWSLGGSILAPIFNGGRLHAQVDASVSRRDQALINYEKIVLTSFSEVEDQLTAMGRLEEEAVQVQEQGLALQEALRVARNRYREGYSPYLDELDAQRNLFNVEQQALQLHAELLTTQVNLYRALGGGWR